eukprot:5425828-Pleurochrysis_carterae.AAC.2
MSRAQRAKHISRQTHKEAEACEAKRRHDTTVSRSSRPCSPSGGWRLHTKYRGYSGKQANLTGTIGQLYCTCKAFWQGDIDLGKAFPSHV